MTEQLDDVRWEADGSLQRPSYPEATFLAFTELYISGRKWNLTLREGTTREDVDDILGLLQYATDAAASMGASYRPEGEEFPSRQVERDSGQTHPQEDRSAPANSERGVWHVTRLEIGGTREAPIVSMFDRNPKLQYPVTKVPSDLLIGILEGAYGKRAFDSSIDKLRTCGEQLRVAWEVAWIQSPKNEKWKDISEIRIPKLERVNEQ